jgi:predicted transcriptional regulator
MADALKKLNFFIEEDIRMELDRLVPVGKKSKVINDAVRKEILRRKRERVTERLLALKAKGRKVPKEEIVEALKKGRRRNN